MLPLEGLLEREGVVLAVGDLVIEDGVAQLRDHKQERYWSWSRGTQHDEDRYQPATTSGVEMVRLRVSC